MGSRSAGSTAAAAAYTASAPPAVGDVVKLFGLKAAGLKCASLSYDQRSYVSIERWLRRGISLRALRSELAKLRQLPDEVEYFDPQVTGKIKITPRRLCGDFSLHHIEGA